MIDLPDAKTTASLFYAIAEPTRVQVVHHLTGGPLHVGKLAELVGIPMVNMSHHLGLMRGAGILDDNRNGRNVVYSLRKDVFAPGDDEHVGVLLFGRYRMMIRRTPTPIPATKPPRVKRHKGPMS